MLNEKKNSKWKVVWSFIFIFIMMATSTQAGVFDFLFDIFADEEELIESPRNIYTTFQRKDISVICYSKDGVTYIEDGQGRKLNFTGLNGYCEPIPDGQEIFFDATVPAIVLTPDAMVSDVVVSANRKDAFDYLDWSVANKEHNISGQLQAWDVSKNVINNYTQEISFTLKDGYDLKDGDRIIIDPIYTISNITLDTIEEDVTCEGGGYFCHLTTNLTEDLVLYMPFDNENNSAVVYDWSPNNYDGTLTGNSIINLTHGLNGSGTYEGFAGGSDGLTGTNADLNPNGNFTISLWVKKLTAEIGSDQYVFDRRGTNNVFIIIAESNERWSLTFYNVSGQTQGIDTGISSAQNTNWNNIIAGYNGSSFIYLNGELRAGSVLDEIRTGTGLVSIGKSVAGGNEFNGKVDEVMVWNRSLSEQEISDVYTQSFSRFNSDVGNHTIKPTFLADENNRVNVTINHANQNFTNLSLRLGQINKSIDNYSGLVLYMPFEWDSTEAWDISGNNNDGTISAGNVWGSNIGLNGTGGFEADTQTGGIRPVENVDFDSTALGDFTVSAWYKDSDNDRSAIVSKGGTSQFDWVLGWNTGGLPIFLLAQSDGSTWMSTQYNVDMVDGKWHHMVGVMDNVTTNITLYIDGVFVTNETETTGDRCGDCSGTFELIGDFGTFDDFQGTLDEVMIFNRSLSAGEILDLYTKQAEEFNHIYYTDSVNMSDNTIETFTITNDTAFIFPDIDYYSDSNKFFSPILKETITMETYSAPAEVVGNAPTKPELHLPENMTSISDTLTIDFNWSNSTDVDLDAITYFFEIWNESTATNLLYANSSITETDNTTETVFTFPNETGDFFWRVLAMDVSNTLNSSWSNMRNITLYQTPVVPLDTCTYSSGDWDINLADNCVISSPVTGDGSIFRTYGTGTLVLDEDVTGFASYNCHGSGTISQMGGSFL